ncbi:MAG: threonylcarbamoyl-AMP synthase [Desulfuromonadales bacterium GWD2_61_12]|nr:MAG: threonylcarbamoyl-AMP synthase [Desulfuromonadales bacterium GWC2_61_20]OGR33022.1 MAG: threonylcarbamoyl-AMP synthase [Desulfuromonadales bacterium GWD2_61_12]HAD03271.1 threonylcarbamoyl-AMP synthase [Desulfuromonas sp.]HBT83871.1 threonylcarbamoyl-AMP synthase [Desulfuromonas sp.]
MILSINPFNPQPRLISRVVECLKQGGVIAYPTDTTYGIGCDIFNRKGVRQIFQLKQRDARKPFSFICTDLSDVATYAQVSNFAFKTMKRQLPGPYTFVLEATRIVPDLLITKQKTVGVRIPDNPIAMAIVRELGHPLVTTSANLSGEEPSHDPQVIEERFGHMLDLVIDGGILLGEPSTVISLIDDRLEVLRQGSGETSWIEKR